MRLPAKGGTPTASGEAKGVQAWWSDCSVVLLTGWRNVTPVVGGGGREGEKEGRGENDRTIINTLSQALNYPL